MSQEFTIHEIAKLMNLSVHTLRYYEKIGLIQPVQRDSLGYRKYTERDLAWLRFINKLRTTGMPVKEMAEFALLNLRGNATIPARRAMLENHREEVFRRIEELSNNLRAIDEKIVFYSRKEAELGLTGESHQAV